MAWSSDVTERLPTNSALLLEIEPSQPTDILDMARRHADAIESALAAPGAVRP